MQGNEYPAANLGPLAMIVDKETASFMGYSLPLQLVWSPLSDDDVCQTMMLLCMVSVVV